MASGAGFFDVLEARVQAVDSLLCVGLDPHAAQVRGCPVVYVSDGEAFAAETNPVCRGYDRSTPYYAQLPEATGKAAFDFCKRLIEATLAVAAAYKPNIAFFEALGVEGWQALLDVMKLIPPEVPVLLDAKRGDISTTADAYATACLQVMHASCTERPIVGHGYWSCLPASAGVRPP